MPAPYSTKVDGVTTIAAAHINGLQTDLTYISVNARAYGAVSDGTTDDTTAVQAACDFALSAAGGTPVRKGVRVIIPDNTRIVSSLNLTNRSDLILEGATPRSRLISAAAGKAAIDMLGSERMIIRNIEIVGEQANAPAVGIFLGRTAGGPNSSFNLFENMYVTGYYVYGGYYSVSSEVNLMRHVDFGIDGPSTAQFAAFITANNDLSLTSVYQTLSGAVSGSQFAAEHVAFQGGAYAAFIPIKIGHGVGAIAIRDSYLSGGTGTGGALQIIGDVSQLTVENTVWETGTNYAIYFDTYTGATQTASLMNFRNLGLTYKVNSFKAKTGTFQRDITIDNIQNTLQSPATSPQIALETASNLFIRGWEYPANGGTITVTTLTGALIMLHGGSSVSITTAQGVFTVDDANGFRVYGMSFRGAGLISDASPSGYSGGELRLTGSASQQAAVSTDMTGAPGMIFAHRGASNTGYFMWQTGTNGGTQPMILDSNGNLSLVAGATNMTKGFFYIPSAAGVPSGTPVGIPTGTVPMYWDSTNLQLYIYTGGVWKKSAAFT